MVALSKRKGNNPRGTQSGQSGVDMARIGASVRFWDRLFGLGRTAVRCTTIGCCFYFLFKTAEVFAGKETLFQAVVAASVRISADRRVAYLLAGITSRAWWRERRIRLKTVENLGKHV